MLKNKILSIIFLLILNVFAASSQVQADQVDLENKAKELQSLHWGMFVCWSLSTFSGREWSKGVTDISLFRATSVDTDQWARTAKEAGMAYILFLTKHHDGFCLWDTKTTDRKVTNAPLKQDVLADLRKSCDKYGIHLALYFSEGEFPDNKLYHPGGYTPEMKKAQLKELLTEYGPIEYIWFDHAQGDGGVSHNETVAWCHQWQPATLVGFNSGEPAGEISLRERGKAGQLGDSKVASYNGKNEATFKEYLLAEFTYPILPAHKGGAEWFYSLTKYDQLCRPADQLYLDYLSAVKFNNIFSLDVGPDYNGRLRDVDVQTLKKVGELIKNPNFEPAKP